MAIGFAPDVEKDFQQSVSNLRKQFGSVTFSFGYDVYDGNYEITVYQVGGVVHSKLDSFFSAVQDEFEDIISTWGNDGLGQSFTVNLLDGTISYS